MQNVMKRRNAESATIYLDWWERTAMIAKLIRWGFFAAVVLGIGNLAAAAQPGGTRPLEIYFIDVDGGAATLLVTSAGESILIDSGWPGRLDRDPKRHRSCGSRIWQGCNRLDHLVTTHWHTDHFGGVAGLARMVEIAHFWDRGLPEDEASPGDFPDGPKPDDPQGIAYRAASTGKRKSLHAGDSLPLSAVCVAWKRSSWHRADT